jgi:hypothetical protein
MKKMTFLFAAALLCLAFAGCGREEFNHEGTEPIPFVFSVAEGHHVIISSGNLQFCTLGSQLAYTLGQPLHILVPVSNVVLLQDTYFQLFFHFFHLSYVATVATIKKSS